MLTLHKQVKIKSVKAEMWKNATKKYQQQS